MKPIFTKIAIVRDFQRYRCEGVRLGLHVLLFCPGFWATAHYRALHWLQVRNQARFARLLLNQICHGLSETSAILTRIALPPSCRIGPGLYIPHHGPVTVNSEACIGADCTLHPGVTIGQAGRGAKKGTPILGDRVYVGVNAIIIGKIVIGNDVAIGAGAVVTKSLPDCAVAVGNPARIISLSGSFELIATPETKCEFDFDAPEVTLPVDGFQK